MSIREAIKARHSVRRFKDMPVWFKNGMLAYVKDIMYLIRQTCTGLVFVL